MPAEYMTRAQQLLDSGSLSPEKAAKLRASMEDYQRRTEQAQTPMGLSRGMLGDPRARSGVESIEHADEVLNEVGLEREPSPEEQVQTQRKVDLQQYVREGQPRVEWTTPGAKAVQSVLEEQAGEALDPAEHELNRARGLEMSAAKLQEELNLPNLSKDPDLLVPSEYKSQKAALNPGVIDAVPFIGHEIWYEPSLEQFRRDMGPVLQEAGINPEQIDENDPLYARYADASWAERYRKAAEKDQSVVRHSQMKEDRDLGAKAVIGGVRHIIGGIMGAADTLTLGAAPEAAATMLGAPQGEMEELRKLQESTPASQVGAVAGALTPGGAAQGLMRLGSKAIPEAAGAGLNLLRSGAIGAGTGAAESLGTDVVQNLGDLSRGAQPTVTTDQMLENAGSMALLGGGFGLLGEGVSQAAKWGKNRLLRGEAGQQLQTMEDAGIEPQLIGRSEPQAVKSARDRTAEAGLGNDTRSMSTQELSQRVAQGAEKMQREAGRELAGRLEAYHTWQEKLPNAKQPIDELTDATVKYMDTLLDDAGRPLPGVEIGKIRSMVPQMFETQEVNIGRVAQMKEAGWRKLPLDPKDDLGVVMGRPRELTARQLSTVLDELDEQARFTKRAAEAGTAPRDRAARELATAARKVRDKFPAHPDYAPETLTAEHATGTTTGYSALNTAYSQAKRDVGDVLEKAGLPREIGTRPQVGGSGKVADLKKRTDDMFSRLSEEEQIAIRNVPHHRINETPELQSALEKMRVEKPTQYGALYRGDEMDAAALSGMLESGEFVPDRLMRTSYSRDLAEVYPLRSSPGKERVLFKVKSADSGYSMVSDNLSMDDFEEMLIPRGSRFKVVGHSVSDGVHVIELASKDLAAALTPAQEQKLGKAIQEFRQTPGGANKDEALLKVARAAGVEQELKMWAGIEAARRVGSRTTEAATVGPGGVHGRLLGSLPALALKSTKTLNRLSAKPLGQAPKPSEELRALLRRLGPSISKADPATGPQPFALLGMASGGGSALGMGIQGDQDMLALDPRLKEQVMAGAQPGAGTGGLTPDEAGWMERFVAAIDARIEKGGEAIGRGIGQSMPKPEAKEQE